MSIRPHIDEETGKKLTAAFTDPAEVLATILASGAHPLKSSNIPLIFPT